MHNKSKAPQFTLLFAVTHVTEDVEFRWEHRSEIISCFNYIKSKDFIMTIKLYLIWLWCPHINLTASTDRGALHLWSKLRVSLSFLQNWLTKLTHICVVSQAETVITVLWSFEKTEQSLFTMWDAKAADFHY